MKFGESFEYELIDRFTKKKYGKRFATYKRTEWQDYHTNNLGEGLWKGDKQIAGTCDFTVAGCKTEKAAKAKIRRYVTG